VAQCQSELQPCRTDHFFLTQQGCMACSDASLITMGHPQAAMHAGHVLLSHTSVFQRETLAKLKALALRLPYRLKSLAGRGAEEKDSCCRETCIFPSHHSKKKGSQALFSRIDETCSCTQGWPSHPLGSAPVAFVPLRDQPSPFGPLGVDGRGWVGKGVNKRGLHQMICP